MLQELLGGVATSKAGEVIPLVQVVGLRLDCRFNPVDPVHDALDVDPRRGFKCQRERLGMQCALCAQSVSSSRRISRDRAYGIPATSPGPLPSAPSSADSSPPALNGGSITRAGPRSATPVDQSQGACLRARSARLGDRGDSARRGR